VSAIGVPPASNFGVFARLALATVLGVGIIFWPYSARCGFGLAAYLGAVTTVIVSGVWSAIWTWRHRWGRAHLLGLLLVLWGLVLLSADVLPRIGYAIPTAAHPAAWSCS
jgi:putative flippase GtrA